MASPLRLSPVFSSRKLAALAFIKRYFAEHGGSPSFGEIAAALDTNTTRVSAIVRQLAREGHIVRDDGERRSIRLPDAAEQISQADAVRRLRALGWRVNDEAMFLGAEGEAVTFSQLSLLRELDHPDDGEGSDEESADGNDAGGQGDARDRAA